MDRPDTPVTVMTAGGRGMGEALALCLHGEPTVGRIPMGRVGTVTEIADTGTFLLSDPAGYMTGQDIRVDGGVTRSV